MPWKLPKLPVRTFARNTLSAVIMQLRFHPILKVVDRPAGFQERVRHRFPGYEQADTQNIEFHVSFGPKLVNEPAHRFRADEDRATLSLVKGSIALEYLAHRRRAVLLEDARLAFEALQAEYSPVSPLRLGLRYVNVIEREPIAEALGRAVGWSDLLTAAFSSPPGDLAEHDPDTTFICEVTSPHDRGDLRVRYGVLVDPGSKRQQFQLDIDRYVESAFAVDEGPDLLDAFSSDIFQVFGKVAGPALLEWMGPEVHE